MHIFLISQCLKVRSPRGAQVVGFGSGHLMRLQSRCQLGLESSEVNLGSLGSAFNMAPSHTGLSTGAGYCQGFSVPHFVALSTQLLKCPHIMAASFLQKGNRKEMTMAFMTEITPLPQPHSFGRTDQT